RGVESLRQGVLGIRDSSHHSPSTRSYLINGRDGALRCPRVSESVDNRSAMNPKLEGRSRTAQRAVPTIYELASIHEQVVCYLASSRTTPSIPLTTSANRS